MHETRIYYITAQSLLPVEFGKSLYVLNMSRWTRLYHDRTDCDRVLRSVIRSVNRWIIEQFSRVRKSSRVRVHPHASSFKLYLAHIGVRGFQHTISRPVREIWKVTRFWRRAVFLFFSVLFFAFSFMLLTQIRAFRSTFSKTSFKKKAMV